MVSKTTLVIGNRNYSSWSLRAWIFLRKNNIEFVEKVLWLDEPEFRQEIDPLRSGGKVPVLIDKGVTVWDSLAIIETAMDRYNCPFGWPLDLDQRTHARSISCEMHSSFLALRNECSMDIREQYDAPLSDAVVTDIKRIVEIWTQALQMSGNKGRWLYGEFSPADAMFAPVVFRFQGYGVELDPLIRAYLDYALADDAFAEWASTALSEGHVLIDH